MRNVQCICNEAPPTRIHWCGGLKQMKYLALFLALPLLAQDDAVVFRSDVLLVRVDAQVRDRANRAIAGLRAEDFVLREQGRVREIRNFAREEMPMDVLMLLDVSGSMRTHVERIASAAHHAFQSLGPDDRIGIMVFDRVTRVRMPFRVHRGGEVERGLERVLDQENFGGGTDISRGIYNAIEYVKQNARRDARRAIVILTDDQTEFQADESGLIRSLARNEIVLSLLLAPDVIQRQRRQTGGIGFPGGGFPGGGGMGWPGGGRGGRGGPVVLGGGGRGTRSAGTRIIAEDSGGDSMSVDQASALEDTLTRLRQRYALHFYLPEGARAGQEREVVVDLSAAARRRYPDAEVRHRRFYVAPQSNSSSPAEVTSSVPQPTATVPDPVSAGDSPAPRTRRRVSDPNSGSGSGPLIDRSSEPASQVPSGGWPKAESKPESPKAEPQPEKKGGWPKAK